MVLTCGQGDVNQAGLEEDIMQKSRMALVDIPDQVIQVCAEGGCIHSISLFKNKIKMKIKKRKSYRQIAITVRNRSTKFKITLRNCQTHGKLIRDTRWTSKKTFLGNDAP